MKIIDTHSHFNLSQFDADRDAAIMRMVEAGVGTICIGIDIETSKKAVEIAEIHKDIWAIVGVHPTHWGTEWNHDKMKKLALQPNVVGIGECGLDYYREDERKAKREQKELFAHQIALAHELDLPLMLHIRPEAGHMDAYEEALLMLQDARATWPTMRGTAHFFAGTREIAERFINLGFHISFSGVITIFPEYADVVASVPIDRILPETDAPFAAPMPYRGTRNEPAYVVEVVKKIAEIKGLSIEETEAQLLKNAEHLFAL
ncbi:MAG: TatD family hydrolase [Candidatus Pacebacteria bacterium]|nr:TatD family hydrolase [Candidatus Paceibacterota bacterium]